MRLSDAEDKTELEGAIIAGEVTNVGIIVLQVEAHRAEM